MGSELRGGRACCPCSTATSSQLLIFLLLACLGSVAAATDTLRQGESLSAPAKLVSSPTGVFEMGFFAPDPNRPSRLYLGIWYRSATPRATVWVANRAAPATSASPPSLTLTGTGDLRVLDGGGAAANATAAPSPLLLWSSNTSSSRASSAPRGGYSAVLQDSGSLQVRDQGEVVWDSFWHPTDTMLPGMQITVQMPAPPAGGATNERMLFTLWASATDPAPGRYALGLDPAGIDQAYIWRDGSDIYWRFSAKVVGPMECGKLESRLHQEITSKLSGQPIWGLVFSCRKHKVA